MPKNEIDYSVTTIYKLCCKNTDVNDVYIGHTTNFIKRKHHHKMCCINSNNTLRIYETMRQNGGWDEWDMIEIEKYNCKNAEEALFHEQSHYYALKKQEYNVEHSKIYKKNWTFIENETLGDKGDIKKYGKYECLVCDYITSRKSHWDRHNLTHKHKKETKMEKGDILVPEHTFICW